MDFINVLVIVGFVIFLIGCVLMFVIDTIAPPVIIVGILIIGYGFSLFDDAKPQYETVCVVNGVNLVVNTSFSEELDVEKYEGCLVRVMN